MNPSPESIIQSSVDGGDSWVDGFLHAPSACIRFTKYPLLVFYRNSELRKAVLEVLDSITTANTKYDQVGMLSFPQSAEVAEKVKELRQKWQGDGEKEQLTL